MNRNHLKQKNTTYFRHLKQAWKEAMCCGLAADLLFDKYFSSYIARAHRKLSNAAWGSITIGME
jgi:hypothetical protein